jgi:hypothetical protein
VYAFGDRTNRPVNLKRVVITVGLPEEENTMTAKYAQHGLVLWTAMEMTPRLEQHLDRNQSNELAELFRAKLHYDGVNPQAFPGRPSLSLNDLKSLTLVVFTQKPFWFLTCNYPPTWEKGEHEAKRNSSPRNE